MPIIRRPFGWGLGVNTIEPSIARRALELLEPDWWFNWHPDLDSADPGFRPLIRGPEVLRPDQVPLFANRTVLILNEPEVGWVPELTEPARAAEFLVDQFYSLFKSGQEFNYVTPNSNVNKENLPWLVEFIVHLRRRGLPAPWGWGFHLYEPGNEAEFQDLVGRMLDFYAQYGQGRPIVITEVSQGRHRSAASQIMALSRKLLGQGTVQGLAWFSALEHQGPAWQEGPWPGLIEPDLKGNWRLTRLGQQFRALK